MFMAKDDLKRSLKTLIFWPWIGLYAIFMDFCPRRATKSEAYVVPKTTYTTLGPKFYGYNFLQ